MDTAQFVGDLLMRMKPAIERRGNRVGHDELFGDVGLAWAQRLHSGRLDITNAEQITWGIVRNLLLAFYRRKGYRRYSRVSFEEIAARDRDGLAVLLEKERDEVLGEALNNLSIGAREVLRQRHEPGETMARRARSQGTCASSERSRYRRALFCIRNYPRVIAWLNG